MKLVLLCMALTVCMHLGTKHGWRTCVTDTKILHMYFGNTGNAIGVGTPIVQIRFRVDQNDASVCNLNYLY